MNAFDKLCALGMKRTTAIRGQTVTVGAVVGVQAVVSAIRQEERFDKNGAQVWVDAGSIAIAREHWPEGQALPNSGTVVVLANNRRYRLDRVTSTDALVSLTFTSLY